MANHIRRFEKFGRWAHRSGIDFYPITDDKVLKYAMDLDARDCGPTVLPSLRTAIRWVAFRVNFKIPSIDTAAMKALEKDVFHEKRQTSQGGDPVRYRAGWSHGGVCGPSDLPYPGSHFHVVGSLHDLRFPPVRRRDPRDPTSSR